MRTWIWIPNIYIKSCVWWCRTPNAERKKTGRSLRLTDHPIKPISELQVHWEKIWRIIEEETSCKLLPSTCTYIDMHLHTLMCTSMHTLQTKARQESFNQVRTSLPLYMWTDTVGNKSVQDRGMWWYFSGEWVLQGNECGICSTCCGLSTQGVSALVLLCGSTSLDNPGNLGFPANLRRRLGLPVTTFSSSYHLTVYWLRVNAILLGLFFPIWMQLVPMTVLVKLQENLMDVWFST